MIRARQDRWFDRFRRTGDPGLLAQVFDETAPELWRVAAHLCRDRHAVEDAVQGTFLAAIEHQQQWDRARPLLPWLLGLLANRVRENRRSAARVPDAARLVKSGERDPAELASHEEFGSAFRTVLRQLGEPYRTAVEAHLVHGKAAPEIAAECGVPAGTVRMRLHRGLEQLRRKLPQGFVAGGAVALRASPESLAAMREIVLAKVPGGAAVATAVPAAVGVFGVLFMNKLVWSVVAVAVAAISLWVAWPQLVGVSDASLPRGPAAVVSTTVRALPEAMRAAEADPAVAAPAQRTRVARDDAPTGRLRVVLRIAGSGAPVAGVGMYAMGGLPQPKRVAADNRPIAMAAGGSGIGSTDANGVATFDLPVGFAQIALRNLPQAGLWYAEVRAGSETEMVVDVPVAVPADVRVVDARGLAVPGAILLGSMESDNGFVERELGRADAGGRWRCAFVEPSVVVRAVAPGYAASPVVYLRGDAATATLQLGAEPATLEGTVFASDGSPNAGAGVVILPQAFATVHGKALIVRTDARGRYECSHVPSGPCRVFAWREVEQGHRRFTQVAAEAVANVRTIVDVRFGRGARVVANLRGAEGPLVGQNVALVLQDRTLPHDFAAYAANHEETDAQGACTIDGVMPGAYELQVATSGEFFREYIELSEGQEYRLDRSFGGSAWVELHVVDEANEALEGWLVVLRPPDETPPKEANVGRDGLVRFDGLAARAYGVSLHKAAGILASVTREVATGVRTEIVVSAAQLPTGSLRGTLVPGDGIGLGTLQVMLQRGWLGIKTRPESAKVEFDPVTGVFETRALPADTYYLAVLQNRSGMVAMRGSIDVHAGAVVDLGRIEVGTGTAEFCVTMGDGSSVRDAFVAVTLVDEAPFSRWPHQSRANGIELALVPAMTFDALVWGPDIAPVTTRVATRIGERTTIPIVAERGTPTTMHSMGGKDGRNMAVVTIRQAGAVLVTEVVDRADAYVRGFKPGSYRIEFEAFDGFRGATDFTVGTTSGPPIEVRVER